MWRKNLICASWNFDFKGKTDSQRNSVDDSQGFEILDVISKLVNVRWFEIVDAISKICKCFQNTKRIIFCWSCRSSVMVKKLDNASLHAKYYRRKTIIELNEKCTSQSWCPFQFAISLCNNLTPNKRTAVILHNVKHKFLKSKIWR